MASLNWRHLCSQYAPVLRWLPVDRVLQGNGVIWRLGVGTIVEKLLVVPELVAHWSCKLLFLQGVEDKNRHVVASEYGAETSDSSTKAFSSLITGNHQKSGILGF